MDEFMARPTDVLRSFMAAHGMDAEKTERILMWGRLAMALELMTVAKIIEDYSLLASKEDTISVIQTLIIDQDLLEHADRWYKELCDWRRIKLADADAVYGVPDVRASAPAVLPDAALPPGSNGAQPHTDQTTDPPSSDSPP